MKLPKHGEHSSGRGRVYFCGVEYYTGPWGSEEADAKYRRLCAEYIATGRAPGKASDDAEMTVGELCGLYSRHALERYRKRGQPTTHAATIVRVATEVGATYGDLPVSEFRPRTLRSLRDSWVRVPPDGGKARKGRETVNIYTGVVVEMFEWGVSWEYVPESVWRALTSVGRLTSRDAAREPKIVTAVPRAVVEATLPHLPEHDASVILLMLCTGLRPSEACRVRMCDLDRTGSPWVYRVDADWNKTEHKGRKRVAFLGPKAQAILLPRHTGKDDDYLFRPRTSRWRGPGAPVLANSLASAIRHACDVLGIERWHPHQARHLVLTERYAKLGMLAARATGGHSNEATTLGYVDVDVASAEEREAARRAALEMG